MLIYVNGQISNLFIWWFKQIHSHRHTETHTHTEKFTDAQTVKTQKYMKTYLFKLQIFK